MTNAYASQPTNPRDNAAPAAPIETQPSQGAPEHATGGKDQGFPTIFILIMALPILLVLFTSRNQSKKQKKLEESLKVGDRVLTRSGLIGKLVEIGDRTAKIDIAPGVTVQMLKSTIEGVDAPPAAAADVKGKDSKESSKEKSPEK